MIIPAIDLLDGKVVRLSQGKYDQVTVYSEDPVAVARDFEKAGAKRLHIVDLSGARKGEPVNHDVIAAIREATDCVIEAGGGIRSKEGFEALMNCGLRPDSDKIMIGSMPIKQPEAFAELAKEYARQILLTVDVWGREIRISGWEEKTSIALHDFLAKMQSLGIRQFLVTQIQKDGMLSGPDWPLYEELTKTHPQAEFIVSGGVASKEDLLRAEKISGVAGVILGRAFYEGKVSLKGLL